MINPDFCQLTQRIDSSCRTDASISALACEVHQAECGFLDLLKGTTKFLTIVAQDIELMLEHGFANAREEIAGVSILSNQTKCLLFARPADEDGWMRPLNGVRCIEWPRQMQMVSCVGFVLS